MRLAREFGPWSQPGVTVAAPVPATDADLELVHDPGYVAAVRTVSGWAEELVPAALQAAQPLRAGVRAGHRGPAGICRHASGIGAGGRGDPGRGPPVWSGSAGHGASIAGGMHHAMAARASGFGVYNDPRSRSPGCWDTAPNGSPTWTSTRTTATGCRLRSGPIRGC